MATYVLFVMWAGCCALIGWLAKRKGHPAAAWVALAVMLSFSFNMLFWIYNQPQWGSIDGNGLAPYGNIYPSSLTPEFVGFLPSLLVLAVVAFLRNRNRRRCPDCSETIQATARICRFCRHNFDQAAHFPAREGTN